VISSLGFLPPSSARLLAEKGYSQLALIDVSTRSRETSRSGGTGEGTMLKAIRKFVFERRRDREGHQPVVEEPGSSDPSSNPDVLDPSSNSDIPLAVAEPQSQEPAAMPVRGQVKWFNRAKRFGFVELSDGSGDAFLHVSVLSRLGISTVQPGETLELRVAPGERGPVVIEVIGVDSSTAIGLKRPRTSDPSPYDRAVAAENVQETGTVKWYNPVKGFGFITRDSGGKDIFVHASALQRAGITSLSEGQRVVVDIAEGRKGPEAASIQLG
jgi:CspA family cold shock protein